MHSTREDWTDAGVRSVVSSERTSLAAWIGDLLGEVEGVIAVYHMREKGSSVHRVWTIPASAADAALATAIKEREELVARKFAEFRFQFNTSAEAKPPEKGAAVVFRRLPE
jgi:hypothetical protein